MIDAYRSMHRLGYAHSVETWIDGELAGGLYGVAIGRVFFGESMFSRSRDASKIALAALVAHLESAGFGLSTARCTLGIWRRWARARSPRRFSRLLEELIHYPHSPGAGPAHPSRRCNVEAERSAACRTAVLRDCTLPLQLSAGPDGALASGDSQPSDRHRALRRPRAARLSRSGIFTYRPIAITAAPAFRCVSRRGVRASRSQRRALAKHAGCSTRDGTALSRRALLVYLRYQASRHSGGGMDQDSRDQYSHFLLQSRVSTRLVNSATRASS